MALRASLVVPLASIMWACSYDWTVPTTGAGGQGGTSVSDTTHASVGGLGGSHNGGSGGVVTGSGGDGGGGGIGPCDHVAGEGSCATCMKDNCCPQLEACETDAHCRCARDCVENSNTPNLCFGACAAMHGLPSAQSNALKDCNEQRLCGCIITL
jgi:hypothetical protein